MTNADTSPVNWTLMLSELHECGVPLSRVAAATGIPKTTLYNWSQGSEPRHQDGELLIALWERVTNLSRLDLPRQWQSANRVYRQRSPRSFSRQ